MKVSQGSSLQDKVKDLVLDVKTLEDLKTNKVEVANAVVNAATVIGLQVAELLKRVEELEDTPYSSALLPLSPLVFPYLPC